MKAKKLLAGCLALAMVAGLLTACGSSSDSSSSSSGSDTTTSTTTTDTDSSDDTAAADTTETASAASSDEIVTLKWVVVGSGMPDNYDSWQATMNAYLEEKIGVDIDVEVVSWGDWDDRRNVIINTNEPVDIIFGDQNNYTSCVELGAYQDITDMIEANMPGLYAMMPEEYWTAMEINGRIYGVPTYKDSSLTNYMIWDEALVEKYDIDISKTTLSELTDDMLAIKNGEDDVDYPCHLFNTGLYYMYDRYDSIGLEMDCVGVRYDDSSVSVVYTLEQQDIYDDLLTIHDWYSQGIINPDAAQLSENPTYVVFGVAQGWPSAGKLNWGPSRGVDVVVSQCSETVLSNQTVQGSINSISSTCQNPEKALQFLDLINTDSWVRDMFYYGEEGVNWDYVDSNGEQRVHQYNTDWTMAGYTQATFFTVTTLDTDEMNQWDEVKELNEQAIACPTLGFVLDTSSIADQIAQCNTVWNKYSSELDCGVLDPEVYVPQIKQELMDAGFQDILDEAQAQIDAWLAEG